MADVPSRPCRFYCHRCSAEISPRLPDYTCPRCGTGFIEEMPTQRSTENGSASTSSTSGQNRPTPENMVHQHSFIFPSGYGLFRLGVFDENLDPRTTQLPTDNNRETENRRERRQRYSVRQPRSRYVLRRQGTRHEGVPTLEGIIQQLVSGIMAPTAIRIGSWDMLHSSPMDYAWGANGLDSIITQLLNRFENAGPPPADGERIKGLPTVSITEEHVGAGLECPVCKEDYSIEERVRQLPCNHLFHGDCIIPWLQQHDTCPVCRKSLSGQNTATDPPGLQGMNFSTSPSPN